MGVIRVRISRGAFLLSLGLGFCLPVANLFAQMVGKLSLQSYGDRKLQTEDGLPLTSPTLPADQSRDCSYPAAAERVVKQPTTILHTVVDRTGFPTEIAVRTSSGSEAFDAAAVECLRKLRFQPAMRAAEPVRWEMAARVDWAVAPPLTQACTPLKKPYTNVPDEANRQALVIGEPSSAHQIQWIAVVCVCAREAGEVSTTLMQSTGDARRDRNVLAGAKSSAESSHFKGPGCMEYAINFKN